MSNQALSPSSVNVPGVHGLVGPGGLPILEVATPACRARIALLGAHLMSWAPAGEAEVLWMSGKSHFENGKPIRGGVPVCFPWFGGLPDPAQPAHGFVRSQPFDLVSVENRADHVFIALEITEARVSAPAWPHPYRLRMEFELGRTLVVRRLVSNSGRDPFTFTGALHTYFTVGDVRDLKVHGFDKTPYVDRLSNENLTQQGPITFQAETDRIHLPHPGSAEIEDPRMKRRIRISSKGSASTVVWNPWTAKAERMPDYGDHEWPGMVCVETANALTDAVTVAGGARHELVARIEVAH